MKPLVFAVLTCALFHHPAWAQGQDGAAQKLPFSEVERGARPLERLPSRTTITQPIGPATGKVGQPVTTHQAGGGSTGPNQTTGSGGVGPADSALGESPFQALEPPTLEDEVERLVDGMVQALKALDRIGNRPGGEKILRDTLNRSIGELQPGSTTVRDYLGPDQNALTPAQLEEATRSFRQILEGAIESKDPRAFLASRRSILEQPEFTAKATDYFRRQQEQGTVGEVTARIEGPGGGMSSGGSAPADAIGNMPYLPGYPNYVIDPATGQTFRQTPDGSWHPAADPR